MVDARDLVKMGVLSLRDWERLGKAVKNGPGGRREWEGLLASGVVLRWGWEGDLPFQEERRRSTDVGIIASPGDIFRFTRLTRSWVVSIAS